MEKIHRLLYPNRIVLVTSADSSGKPNIVTLAWCCPLSADPPLVGISLTKKRYSYQLISETKEFVINIPPYELADAAMVCGTRSGRNTDKFKEAGLTQENSGKVKPPRIRECYAHLECKLVNGVETGDHILMIGEVLKAHKKKDMPALYDAGGAGFIEIKE